MLKQQKYSLTENYSNSNNSVGKDGLELYYSSQLHSRKMKDHMLSNQIDRSSAKRPNSLSRIGWFTV